MTILDPLFIIQSLGILGIFFVIFAESGLFFGFFLPGDSLLFVAGLLAAQGYLHIIPLLIGTFIAAVVGDNFGYAFGNKYGDRIWQKEDSLLFKKSYIKRTEEFYEKYGKKVIILCRFIPIVRTFAPIMAGVGKMNYRIFFLYNLVGAFVWTFSVTLLGYFLGKSFPQSENYLFPIILGIIILSFIPPFIEYLKNRKRKEGDTESKI